MTGRTVECPDCQTRVPEGDDVCECGYTFGKPCAGCGTFAPGNLNDPCCATEALRRANARRTT